MHAGDGAAKKTQDPTSVEERGPESRPVFLSFASLVSFASYNTEVLCIQPSDI